MTRLPHRFLWLTAILGFALSACISSQPEPKALSADCSDYFHVLAKLAAEPIEPASGKTEKQKAWNSYAGVVAYEQKVYDAIQNLNSACGISI